MIMEGYKYTLDELYQNFKCSVYDIIYNVENDEDVSQDESALFLLYLEQLKDDFSGVS